MDESPVPRSPSYRLGGMPGFIPLNEESTAITTRGQHLPGLIQSRSNTSLYRMHQRRGSHRGTDDEASGDDLSIYRAPSGYEQDVRKMNELLNTPQMRSMRLIGSSNPRYKWEQYYKTPEELKQFQNKAVRAYHERNNFLITQYLYIDRLLDSSLPHNLIQEYHQPPNGVNIPATIQEEQSNSPSPRIYANGENTKLPGEIESTKPVRVKRTAKSLYTIPDEETSLLGESSFLDDMGFIPQEDIDSSSRIVTLAIYVNFIANFVLLLSKIAVIVLTSSLSVLASLVDASLDFLSTAIVWTTTYLISRRDQYAYPVGRRRLEPVGVLVFSIIMITSFFQVALQCISRLSSPDHSIVQLTLPSILIMLSTVIVKGFCYVWCRMIKNSSVQALAQDAITDIVFNTFSIIFPLLGFYLRVWSLDALGGLILSIYVIVQWSATSSEHIRNLTGAAATADERNILLYLAMRFAKPIKAIQGLQAYHAGDRINVEADIVLDEEMSLRDVHDLGESLQYVLESVPYVERAFVHADYATVNLASHLDQMSHD